MVVTGKPSATLLSAYTAVGTADAQYFLFCLLIIIRLKSDDYKILKAAPDSYTRNVIQLLEVGIKKKITHFDIVLDAPVCI